MIHLSDFFTIEKIKKRFFWFPALLFIFFGVHTVHAEVLPEENEFGHVQKRFLAVPFPYFNDTIGSGVGVAAIAEGYVQNQMLTVGSGMFGTTGNYMMFLMIRNCQVPFMKRLIFNPMIADGSFEDVPTYTLNSPDFLNEDAGNNDSDADNFIEGDGDDFWFELNFQYLLPIGHGKKSIFPKFKTDNGFIASGETGGEHCNPLTSGRTLIEFTPFYRNQNFNADEKIVQKTAGFDVGLTYDNTDFKSNPSRGSYQQIYLSRDWGGFDSSRPWTVMGGEVNK